MADILFYVACTVAVGGFCYINGKIAGEVKSEKELRRAKIDLNELKRIKRDRDYFRSEYYDLVGEYNLLVKKVKNKAPEINTRNDLVKKALKNAMANSHPDRGGNSEEFIAYKKLWDEARGK